MCEPGYIYQDYVKSEDQHAWIEKQIDIARSQGFTFFRAAIHTEIPGLVLVEGWKEQPEDQGDPRFNWRYNA